MNDCVELNGWDCAVWTSWVKWLTVCKVWFSHNGDNQQNAFKWPFLETMSCKKYRKKVNNYQVAKQERIHLIRITQVWISMPQLSMGKSPGDRNWLSRREKLILSTVWSKWYYCCRQSWQTVSSHMRKTAVNIVFKRFHLCMYEQWVEKDVMAVLHTFQRKRMLPFTLPDEGKHIFQREMLSDSMPGQGSLRALEFECFSVVTHFSRLMLHRKCPCPSFHFSTRDLVRSSCLMDIWLAARQSPLSSLPVSASLHLSFLCWWGGEEEPTTTTTTKNPWGSKVWKARSSQTRRTDVSQMWPAAAGGTLKLAGLHTGCFVHLLLPNSTLPLPGHASVSPPLAFEVRTRLRKLQSIFFLY